MRKVSSNIVLIGMPGAGKSTVGVLLAKQMSCGFVDTDLLIQSSQGRVLQDIVDTDGPLVLRKIEEEMLLGLSYCNHVIATGGSAPYSDAAMRHLKSKGIVIFLDVDLPTLESRVSDVKTRGLAKRRNQSFADLFYERFTLYNKYADVTINCTGLIQDEVCFEIISELKQKS